MDDTGEDPAHQVGAAALRDVVNQLAGTFFILDEAGHFILWSKQVESATALTPDQLRNIHMLELVAQGDRPKVAAAFCTVFQQNEQVEVEAGLLLNGRCVPYVLWGARMLAHGQAYLCGMGMDVAACRRRRPGDQPEQGRVGCRWERLRLDEELEVGERGEHAGQLRDRAAIAKRRRSKPFGGQRGDGVARVDNWVMVNDEDAVGCRVDI